MKLSTAKLLASIILTAMMFIVWMGVAKAIGVNTPAMLCGCFLVGCFGANIVK